MLSSAREFYFFNSLLWKVLQMSPFLPSGPPPACSPPPFLSQALSIPLSASMGYAYMHWEM